MVVHVWVRLYIRSIRYVCKHNPLYIHIRARYHPTYTLDSVYIFHPQFVLFIYMHAMRERRFIHRNKTLLETAEITVYRE